MEQLAIDALVTDERIRRAVTAANRKARKPKRADRYVEEFARQIRAFGLPPVEREALFAKQAYGRLWRADFLWREPYMLIVEIEGLVVRRLAGQLVVMGRHASITGFREDAIKYGSATALGYSVMRFAQKQVTEGLVIEYTQRALVKRGWGREA